MGQGMRPEQLSLHSDNGSPMKGATMLVTLQKLGVVSSFSRPSMSNDNPYSEALFRTLKIALHILLSHLKVSRQSANGWRHLFSGTTPYIFTAGLALLPPLSGMQEKISLFWKIVRKFMSM